MSPNVSRKPLWLKKKTVFGARYWTVRDVLDAGALATVCEESLCPNRGECYSHGTATFLILGTECTRSCRYCAVSHGVPGHPVPDEPARVAEAVGRLKLTHAVLTSVTRDDLPDGGAGHFAATVREIRRVSPETTVEILVPDFRGETASLDTVLAARPDVFNHNIETVPRLYSTARPEADYRRSLAVLKYVRDHALDIVTKSSIMMGLGETTDEVAGALDDLRESGCSIVTIGQYLQPREDLMPVARFVSPDEFDRWRERALILGFAAVESGPYVRSSYNAGRSYAQSLAANT